jgi:hypothetical protein
MFDDFGRVIPKDLVARAHTHSRRYFSFPEIKVDLEKSYSRIKRHLGPVGEDFSLESFCRRVEEIKDELRSDDNTAGILNGLAIPFFIPKQAHDDVGGFLDSVFLPAVLASYKETFPDYSFDDHNAEPLAGRLSPVLESRQPIFLNRVSSEGVVGILFPCLTEFSIPAAVEATAALPECFILSGGLDICAALVACPELLFKKEGYPPMLWMSGIEAETEGVGYHFEAYGYNLTFNRRTHLGQCAEYWSSSLVVID